MEYSVTYQLKHQDGSWWYVQGVVRDESGRAVRWSAMTAHCMKEDAERMYHEYYERWNDDPQFNHHVSGDWWCGEQLP